MQAEAQHIDGWLEELAGGTGHQRRHRPVRGDQVPVPIDRQRREGLVTGEHQLNSLPRGAECRVVQLALGEDRRITGGQQEGVALAKRHAQSLAQTEHHLAARPRPPRLDEAEMPGGHLHLERQFQLAHAPALAPVAQMLADGPDSDVHRRELTRRPAGANYLAGN